MKTKIDNLSLENAETWLERFEAFVAVKLIGTTMKAEEKADFEKNLLIASMGAESYEIVRNHLLPVQMTKATAKQIKEKIIEVAVKKNSLKDGLEIQQIKQRKDESDVEWMSRVKSKATRCNFGDSFDLMVRNIFVQGLSSQEKRAFVFKELNEKATSQQALEQADKFVDLDIKVNQVSWKRQSRPNEVRTQGHANKPSTSGTGGTVKIRCFRCKGPHFKKDCPKRNEKCRHCHKTGHDSDRCWHKNKDQERVDSVFSVDAGNRSKVTVTVDQEPVEFEIDTGASITTIGLKDFKSRFKDFQHGRQTVRCANGSTATVLGHRETTMCTQGKTGIVTLKIMEDPFPTLLGRDALDILFGDWKSRLFDVGQLTSSLEKEMRQSDIFKDEIGLCKEEARLHLKTGAKPKFVKARAVPFAVRGRVEEALKTMIDDGVLIKVESSEWASPIVAVPKANGGEIRVCGDFKSTLNPELDSHSYPLPSMEECLKEHSGAKVFTKIDIRAAYNSIPLAESDQELTTMNTPLGLLRWLRLPFGIKTSSSIFQELMDRILSGLERVTVRVDDILISGRTEAEHEKLVREVVKRLEAAGLRCRPDKSEFGVTEVKYLGHLWTTQGIRPLSTKLDTIKQTEYPRDRDALVSFLGLVQYYSRFIPNMSFISEPLNVLRRKEVPFVFGTEEKRAVDQIKEALCDGNFLSYYDPSCPVIVDTDASSFGIGGVISIVQDGVEKPVEFVSRTLTQAERRWAQIDREAVAIVWSLKRLSVYLRGRKFTVRTDHEPLKHLFSPTARAPEMVTSRRQRWAIFLSEFDYDIEYRETGKHSNADFCSRFPMDIADEEPETDFDVIGEVSAVEEPFLAAGIAEETARDPVLSKVMDGLINGFRGEQKPALKPYLKILDELSVEKGVIKRNGRAVIPFKMQGLVLKQLHVIHLGLESTKRLSRSYVWWPDLDSDIAQMIKACEACKLNQPLPKIEYHPWRETHRPGERVHIDLCAIGQMNFLVYSDSYSRWLEVVRLKDTTALTVTTQLRNIFANIGIPEVLVSDNGVQLSQSTKFTTFLLENGIRYIPVPTYSPWSNGLAEVCVRIFKSHMEKLGVDVTNVSTLLPRFLLNYRATPHSVTGVSPAKRMMGRELRTVLDSVILPEEEKSVGKEGTPGKRFNEGQRVLIYNVVKKRWEPGRVMECTTGNVVRVLQNGLIRLRHRRHIIAAATHVSLPN